MKILVTGSNGLLGQKLIYLLKSKNNIELIATSIGSNRLIDTTGYQFYSLDICNKGQVDSIVNNCKPDVIINTAAMTNVDACETDKEGAKKLNIDAVNYLVETCETNNIHLIHLSTDFIFDGENGPYKEEDAPHPLSYYAYTKNEGEKIIMSSKLKKWTIVRTILVYGIVDNMSRSNIVLWVRNSLIKKQKINVVDDQFRSPTLAEDLAEACWLIAQKKATGVYHISGEHTISILELAQKVANHFNLDKSLISPISSASLKQPAKRPPRTGFIIKKAIKDLGFTPHSFEDGLKIVDLQINEQEKRAT